jgi:hypothetical protein
MACVWCAFVCLILQIARSRTITLHYIIRTLTIRILGTVTGAGKEAVCFEITYVITVKVAGSVTIDSEINTIRGDVLVVSSWTAGSIYLSARYRRGGRRGGKRAKCDRSYCVASA